MNFAIYRTFRLALKKAGAAVSRNGRINGGGFTLIELLVYMAIMSFVIVVAGRAFSDSTRMRVRSQNMLASSEEAGKVSVLLKEDISQMGAKSVVKSTADGLDTVASVNIGFPQDLSSYTLDNSNANFDKLSFRKLHYDATGKCGQLLVIEWSVANNSLIRKCSVLNSVKPDKCTGTFVNTDCPEQIEMAQNVKKFKLLPSKPGASNSSSNIKFPASGNSFKLLSSYGSGATSPSDNASRYTIGNFTKNTATSGPQLHSEFYLAEAGSNSTNCKQFSFNKNEIYSIDFFLRCDEESCKRSGSGEKYGSMVMFQAGRDHLSVGLRNKDKTDGTQASCTAPNTVCAPDFLFYPPQNTTANKVRHFEFSVPDENVQACIGITAAFYSEEAYKGILDLENFRVSTKTDNVYHFDRNAPTYNPDNTTNPNRASVKAFELTLEIDKKNEINRTVTVIPVPNNGASPAQESL